MSDNANGVLCSTSWLDFDSIAGLDNAVDVLKVVAKGLNIRKKALEMIGQTVDPTDKSTAFIKFKGCEVYLDYSGGRIYRLGLTRRDRPFRFLKAYPIYKDNQDSRKAAARIAEWISAAVMSSHDALRYWDGFYVELLKKYANAIEDIQFKNGDTFLFTISKGWSRREFQLVVGYNEEHDIWSAKLYSIKKSDDSYDVDIDLVHEYSSLERRAVYTKALRGIEEVLGNQG